MVRLCYLPLVSEFGSAAQICIWILDYGLAAVETRQLDIVLFHNTSGGRWKRAGQYSVVLVLWCFSFNPLYLKTSLSQMIGPPHHIWKFPVVSPCHIITQRIELVFAALLQIKPGRMLDCSASAFVSRLSDVKQLDGPVWASARFPELNVHIQLCLRQNSGIPFSPQPAP